MEALNGTHNVFFLIFQCSWKTHTKALKDLLHNNLLILSHYVICYSETFQKNNLHMIFIPYKSNNKVLGCAKSSKNHKNSNIFFFYPEWFGKKSIESIGLLDFMINQGKLVFKKIIIANLILNKMHHIYGTKCVGRIVTKSI